ncbi:GntR family transcriptional regulator [Rhizobium mongolense]|uniref:DNA-binding GntR family transcriptional regulator n=1 Tax=Rhizobium mongolense TaxID=57676 RepID=A0A7W6RP33_9HYPH|nr:GntR family transcriptional regulator [Rhizobium mongolense]MBB4276024.1 DNA-binding GntR family transcriptional regulator [Rhizobium mongolense]
MTERCQSQRPAIGQRADAAQDVVYRWLKQHVLTLPSREGTFLTEAEVCRETGTSRTPVREALLRLEADGLLQIVPKKGAYVPPITETEIEAVMQARGLVEEWCARQAAGYGDMLAAELDRLIARQVEVQHDTVAFIECDRDFHRTIVRAAGNPVLADFYESLRDRQLRMGVHAITIFGGRGDSVLAEHAAIAEGIRRGQPEQAAAAVAQHLAQTLVALRLPTAAGWGLVATERKPAVAAQ